MASVNKVVCPSCKSTLLRSTKQLNVVVKRSGAWVCGPCATAATNVRRALPVGTTRVHKKTGYIEEKTNRGWKRQHIAVMERHLGRPLLKGEVVHHKNEVKSDNSLSNLDVMTNGEHTTLHHTGSKRSAESAKNIARAIRLSDRTALSERAAEWIRAEMKNGTTQKSMAEHLGVSKMTVSRVVNNKTWR